jgi:tRNA threonylcarbamoyladenosine dehydratase
MNLHSHRTQLVLTALAASASTAALFSAYTTWDRRRRREHLAQDVLRSVNASLPPPPEAAEDADRERKAEAERAKDAIERPFGNDVPYDEELIREQLARNYAFFGEEGMQKLRGGRVVIVGCGGVGSWAAVMLARS